MSRIDTLISLPKNLLTLVLVSQLTTLDCFGQTEIEFTTIGNQSWTSQNFSGVTFRNGDTIEESTSKEEWLRAGYRGEPSWCYYKFDKSNSDLGRLYNYYAVSSDKNLAPTGWRIATFFDYFELVKYLDPLISFEVFNNDGSLAGGSLKAKEPSNWEGKTCNQIDSRFNAIASGGYSPSLKYPVYD